MAIDYLLGVHCEPQKRLGGERLVNLHRTRILARSALAHMREDGDARPPNEIEIQLTTRKPQGDSGRGVTLQDLFDEAKPLDTVAEYCERCPAELPREFACHRRIRYPIPERVEAWIMSRLPKSLGCTAGAFLVRALAVFDGAPSANLRGAGDTYFESREAFGMRWESPDGTIEVSSDQLIQMMFLVRKLDPQHCLMLALLCGVIPHDTSLHDLEDAASKNRVLAAASLASEPDPEIEQMAAFLRAVATAARLDIPIFVDG